MRARTLGLVLGAVLLAASPARADFIVFGQDLNRGLYDPNVTHPLADTARDTFQSLTALTGIETFDAYDVGRNIGLPGSSLLFAGSGTTAAIVSDYAYIRNEGSLTGNSVEILTGFSGHDRIGFTLAFSDPVSAWAFYGLGFGTSEERSAYVNYTRQDGTTGQVVIPYHNPLNDGHPELVHPNVLFFGLFSPESPIVSLTLEQSILSGDRLSIDDMAVARRIVPEPAVVLLLSVAMLLSLRWSRRRRMD